MIFFVPFVSFLLYSYYHFFIIRFRHCNNNNNNNNNNYNNRNNKEKKKNNIYINNLYCFLIRNHFSYYCTDLFMHVCISFFTYWLADCCCAHTYITIYEVNGLRIFIAIVCVRLLGDTAWLLIWHWLTVILIIIIRRKKYYY